MSKKKSKAPKVTKAEKKVVEPTKAQKRHLDHLAKVEAAAKVVASKKSTKKEKKAARTFLDEATAATEVRQAEIAASTERAIDLANELGVGETPFSGVAGALDADADLKAKIAAKRKAREASFTDERAADQAAQWANLEAQKGKKIAEVRVADEDGKAVTVDVIEPVAPKKGKRGVVAEASALTDADLEAGPKAQVAEVVETEEGTIIAVGTPDEEGGIVAPAEVHEVERDWMGRPEIYFFGPGTGKEKGKVVVKKKGYTRMTTYIDCLEDKTQLDKWKLRTLIAGLTIDTTESRSDAERQAMIPAAADLIHNHDVALKKLAKRARKGELDLGQFALIRDNADRVYRDGMQEIAEAALDLAGAHDKAQKGTDLHALAERYDKGELKLDDPELTDVDRADLTAYAEKMAELGIEHVGFEQFVVNDALQVGGTFDRMSLYKPRGGVRRKRVIGDIKTGRIDYSMGKIGMQIYGYATSDLIDPESADKTGRKPLGADKTIGLLIHLPQGQAKCEVYEVDLKLASVGYKLASEVRAWRNTGKKTFDVKAPLTKVEA